MNPVLISCKDSGFLKCLQYEFKKEKYLLEMYILDGEPDRVSLTSLSEVEGPNAVYDSSRKSFLYSLPCNYSEEGLDMLKNQIENCRNVCSYIKSHIEELALVERDMEK